MTTTTAPTDQPLHYYTDAQSAFQAYKLWLPRPLAQSDPTKTLWIIYIHGGAWRDPLQTLDDASPTATHLLPHAHIAGLISLNYRLSPYPSHATHPSSPSDADRNARHPTHVRDMALGIAYVVRKYGITRWIAYGHSCGATMLMQYVARIGVDSALAEAGGGGGGGPEGVVLSAGIYNVPLFVRNHAPPRCADDVAEVYAAIVAGAYGADDAVWQGVSPVAGRYDASVWPRGRLVVLAHSYEDGLVERQQRDVMCVALDRQGWAIVMEEGDEEGDVGRGGKRILEVRDIRGEHDFVWQDGEQSARLIREVVERLVG